MPASRAEWTNWIETARRRDIRQAAVENGARLCLDGLQWIGPCPICGGDDRLVVNPQKRTFTCRGSDDDHGKGDVIDLVMHVHGCDLLEAVERITGTFRPDRTRDESAEDRRRREASHAGRAAQYARRQAKERAALAEPDPSDAIRHAIEAAAEIDVVKHIRDRARASEIAARRAKNDEAHFRAREIRLRAERRAGQILKIVKRPTGRLKPGPTPPLTLEQRKISRNQSSHWQKLADLPQEIFDAKLRKPVRQTPKSPITLRVERCLERKRLGLRVVSLELRERDIDALVRRNWLDPQARSDIRAVQKALHAFHCDFLGGPDGPPKPSRAGPPL